MNRIVYTIATLLTLAAVFAFAIPANWQITDKYNITFTAGGEVGGIFKAFRGTIAFDEQNLPASGFDLTIDVASVNTGNGLMNTHLKGADWLDAGKFPTIHFVSKKIDRSGNGYQVTGILDMHGVSKELTVPFTFQRNGAGGTFAGKFFINRSDFHIGKAGGEVDEKINLDIKVPVTKK